VTLYDDIMANIGSPAAKTEVPPIAPAVTPAETPPAEPSKSNNETGHFGEEFEKAFPRK
jgi:hypothetical protein